MSVITEIVRNIVALALIFSCLELFLPRGELSRFVRLACGLIMLALIIIPISDALQDLSFPNPFAAADDAAYADYEQTAEQISLILETEAMNEYEQEASRQVEGVTILAQGISSAEAAVEAAADGSFERVEITATAGTTANATTTEQIKKLLNSYLGIDQEIIHIQLKEDS